MGWRRVCALAGETVNNAKTNAESLMLPPALRNRPAAVTRIGFLDIGRGAARRRLEQFLQEGGLAAARRRLARLEGDHMAILQAVMAHIRHLVGLVEIDRQHLTPQHRRREESNLLFG